MTYKLDTKRVFGATVKSTGSYFETYKVNKRKRMKGKEVNRLSLSSTNKLILQKGGRKERRTYSNTSSKSLCRGEVLILLSFKNAFYPKTETFICKEVQ